MTLKSSWMVMAVMFLGQSTVLALPFDSNLPTDPSDLFQGVTPDRSKTFWGLNPKENSYTDIPYLNGISDALSGDSYQKSFRRDVSDVDSKGRSSCDSRSNQVRYAGAQSRPGDKDGETQDPTWINDNANNRTSHSGEYQSAGDSHHKKNTKSIDGSTSDPTLTDDLNNSTVYSKPKPKSNHGDSYGNGKRVNNPLDGTIWDPTFTSDLSRSNIRPEDSCYSEEKGSDALDTESQDPKYTTTSPVDDHYNKKNTSTISDAEVRRGHTATGQPCTVPSSSEHDQLANSDQGESYLSGKEHCTPDVERKSENIFQVSKSYPYNLGNGVDNNEKQS